MRERGVFIQKGQIFRSEFTNTRLGMKVSISGNFVVLSKICPKPIWIDPNELDQSYLVILPGGLYPKAIWIDPNELDRSNCVMNSRISISVARLD